MEKCLKWLILPIFQLGCAFSIETHHKNLYLLSAISFDFFFCRLDAMSIKIFDISSLVNYSSILGTYS